MPKIKILQDMCVCGGPLGSHSGIELPSGRGLNCPSGKGKFNRKKTFQIKR